MVDTINELSDLSRKLNQKSDQINTIISSVNRKLAAMNFGVEVWLEDDPILSEDPEFRDEDEDHRWPRQEVTLLGYGKIGDAWELIFKEATIETNEDHRGMNFDRVVNSCGRTSLLKAPRNVRAEAMRLVPALLDEIKAAMERLLKQIDAAERAANALIGEAPKGSDRT